MEQNRLSSVSVSEQRWTRAVSPAAFQIQNLYCSAYVSFVVVIY